MKKKPMPGYYGKNIVQHAQRRFFQRKALEADQKKRQEGDGLQDKHGERDHP